MTPASPTEREMLERQHTLLAQALQTQGLPREQRRVQTRLLQDTRRQHAENERVDRALAAGYEPFEPATDWLWGYVEDPRFLGGHTTQVSFLVALPISGAALAALLLTGHFDALGIAAAVTVVPLGLHAALRDLLAKWAQNHDARLEQPIRVFNSAMPPAALQAYGIAVDSRLFDTFAVYSPRAKDFRLVEAYEKPSLGLLDPVLAGRIGHRSFLIAQWDLGRDLLS
ncbi:MAG: hypothetical protein JO247_00740 [Chloroflexi bacterium]|nr:hypothetical protein [Chloroflexota bacterium]